MKKYIYYIILSIIFIFWIYFRVFDLATPSLWIDEWYSSIVSYYASINHFIPYLPTWEYDFSQYLFTIFQSLSFSTFWINDLSARIPSLIFWVLNIVLLYLFTTEIFKDHKHKYTWVIFTMILFTFSTWQIVWSREARFYELLSFIYLSNIFLLWKYLLTNKLKYYILFLLWLLIWIIFHPFCYWLIIISILILSYKYYLDRNKEIYKLLSWVLIVIWLYLIYSFTIKYFTLWVLDVSKTIPVVNYSKDYHFWRLLSFYLDSIYYQLWIIFIFYIFWVLKFLYKKQFVEFILFWLVVFINIVIISAWFMAHTRYMFHIYWIITLIWWYTLFDFYIYLIWLYKYKFKKSVSWLMFVVVLISLFETYMLTISPQSIYDIDFTSPKPNFKWAYEYLNKLDNKWLIVSWFPQMCYWYNLDNKEKCKYGLRVDLVWTKSAKESVISRENDNYTNIELINDLNDIQKNNYYFVLDDLTITSAINKELVKDITENCDKIYEDKWDDNDYNYIWVWKCG